jgi:hypothetical protein
VVSCEIITFFQLVTYADNIVIDEDNLLCITYFALSCLHFDGFDLWRDVVLFTVSICDPSLQFVSVLAQVKMDKDAVQVLLQPVETIDRHVQEIQQLGPQVENLEYKLDVRGQGVKSLEQIQLELNSVQRTRYLILRTEQIC